MTNAKFPILTDEQKAATDRAKRVLKAWFDRGCPHNFDISTGRFGALNSIPEG